MLSRSPLYLAVTCLCVLSFGSSTLTPARPQDIQRGNQGSNEHYPRYQELVERAKKEDPTVDFVQLISAASDLYLSKKATFDAPNREAMVEAFKKKDYKKAVLLAEIVLDYEFTNRGLHLATRNAYEELRDKARANFHSRIADKILAALLTTGDGKSVETAYCVQSINEEYVIMRHFGYKVTSQSYILSEKTGYDLLSGKDEKTGKAVGLYFDISGLFSRCVQSHQAKKT